MLAIIGLVIVLGFSVYYTIATSMGGSVFLGGR